MNIVWLDSFKQDGVLGAEFGSAVNTRYPKQITATYSQAGEPPSPHTMFVLRKYPGGAGPGDFGVLLSNLAANNATTAPSTQPAQLPYVTYATVLAHEIGHSLNLMHRDEPKDFRTAKFIYDNL